MHSIETRPISPLAPDAFDLNEGAGRPLDRGLDCVSSALRYSVNSRLS
jgi:hypothetical protein